eukprot:6460499-Amphidinium_carterae.2
MSHIAALSVKEALSGKKMGNELRFAERTLGTLDTSKFPTETTTLNAQIQAVKDATKVSAENVATLSSETRRTTLANVAKMTRSFPENFMGTLLAVELRDLVLEKDFDVRTWVGMLSPVVSGKHWIPRFLESRFLVQRV